MTRRLVRFAPFLLLLLAGCVTYSDDYYRDGYYSDGGYYYPAEDGYGDYYAGPDYDDYDYYDDFGYYSQSPFWGSGHYGCGAWSSCSPYWSSYYRRPYSGWSLSFGSHWSSWGYWGGYGHHWSPWYGYGHYRPRPPVYTPPPPRPIDTAHGVGGVRPTPMPRTDFRDRYPDGKPYAPGDGRVMPRGDFRGSGGKPYAPGDGRLAPRPQPDPAERPARPMPRSDFRDDRQNGKGYGPGDGRVMPQPAPRYGTRNPGGTSAPPTESVVSPQPRPVPRSDFRGNGSGKSYAPSDRRVMPQPQPAAQSRYERPMVRETTRPSAPSPRYQAPAVRQPAPAPRYERPVARETARPAPAPREAPPSRPTRETRSSSQNGTRDDEP